MLESEGHLLNAIEYVENNHLKHNLSGIASSSNHRQLKQSVVRVDQAFAPVTHPGGFDVVIANPPYVEHKKLKGISSKLKTFYLTYSGTADLYVYFYEKGLKILKDEGTLVFITSNKFIKTRYGENLRKFFINYRINEIIDFTEVHIFEALVSSCIFSVLKRSNSDNKIKIAFANDTLLV